MRSVKKVRFAAPLVLAMLVTGCESTRYAEKADAEVEIPEAFATEGLEDSRVPVQQWAEAVNTPELDALMQRMFDENYDWRAAWSRLRQAQAFLRQSEAGLFPTVSGNFSATRRKQENPLAEYSPQAPEVTHQTLFTAGLSASYELDVWGRVRSRVAAAESEFEASRAETRAMAVSLSAQLARTYFQAVATRQRLDLLEEQAGLVRDQVDLVEWRVGQGQATAPDLAQQQQQRDRLEGQLTLTRQQLDVLTHQIAVLVGTPPQGFQLPERDALPTLPPLPEPLAPAELLHARPDLQAAYHRLQAADSRTAARVAEYLPTLQLSARVFDQASEVQNLFEELLWSIAGEAGLTLFDGGARAARVDAAEAEAETQLYNYAQTWLEALQDVGDALVAAQRRREYVASLESQVESASSAFNLVRRRYALGGTDYLRVLDTQRQLFQAEQELVDARQQLFLTRIDLLRALGGVWTEPAAPQLLHEPAVSLNPEDTQHEGRD